MGRFLTGVSLLLLIIGNAFTVAAAEGESETLPPADLQAIESLVERWDDVLSKRDNAQPQSLYMPQVEWYGQSLSAQQVLANEQAFLAKNTDFCQSIVSTLNIQRSYEDKNIVLVSFVKRAGLTYENEQNYPQEMQVTKSALGWRIVSETDDITLANQSKEKSTDVARGKFDGKNKSYVWMREADPRTGGACLPYSKCDCSLWSSDPRVSPIIITQCLIGNVETISGLDNSGRDRVVVSPEWWSSAERVVYVFDIQQYQWIRVMPGFMKNLNIQETATAADLLQPDPQHPGQVKVTTAYWDLEKDELLTKVINKKLWVLD
ncbi:hypothetical protein [Escherichia albertii]|uniref:hypothetical protein n=1 Tax=Escherichia albertii TaxID=208962 RepID=UPI0011F22F68|nr:hypothetical protein [Escherichia albertii]MCZ9166155.1 hypothetical protein [Escherichia albertii]